MLQPIDDATPIQIRPEYVPQDSYLYKLISGSSMIPVTKNETGAIKTSSTRQELELLKSYVETGEVQFDKMDAFFEVADYYGTYSLKANYNQEFIHIKMKEDWLRKVFNKTHDKSSDVRSNHFRLLELTQRQISSFKLISNLHYLYAYKVAAPKTNLDISGLITQNINESTTLKTLKGGAGGGGALTKDQIDRFLDESKTMVSHRYPREHVTGSSKVKLLKQIQQTVEQFKQRDKLFESDLIRECKRQGRQISKFHTGEMVSSKWQQTVKQVYATLQSYPVCKIFDTKPDIWNNIVLAGGSVSNAVLGCNLQVDYDLFMFGLTEEQANDKVVECIKLLSAHHAHAEIRRSKNAITYIAGHRSENWYRSHKIEIQFILRLYSSISEVLHGFDVDSCCVGYDGRTVFMTERADYAFRHMVNTVDFDRLSPSYEFRLHKYMTRGFSVNVPGFKWNKIDLNKVLRYRSGYDEDGGNGSLPVVPNVTPGYGGMYGGGGGMYGGLGLTLPTVGPVWPGVGPAIPTLAPPAIPTIAPAIPTLAPAIPTIAPPMFAPYTGLPGIMPVGFYPTVIPYPTRRGRRYRGYTTGSGFDAPTTSPIQKHLKPLKGLEILINGHFVPSYKRSVGDTDLDGACESDYDAKASRTEKLEAEKIKLGMNKDDEIISYSIEHHVGEMESISQIFNFIIPERCKNKYKFKVPTQLEWLKSQIGDELNGSFHKAVLNDVDLWYTNRFTKEKGGKWKEKDGEGDSENNSEDDSDNSDNDSDLAELTRGMKVGSGASAAATIPFARLPLRSPPSPRHISSDDDPFLNIALQRSMIEK